MASLTHKRSVLLVVDDPDQLTYLSEHLCSAEFEVHSASSPKEAVPLLEEARPAVVLLASRFGAHEDRLRVLIRARALDPHIRVIVHAPNTSKEVGTELLQHGAHEYSPTRLDHFLAVERIKHAWRSHALEVERDELIVLYETLFEAIPGVVWFLTGNGVIRRVSQQSAALLEYEPEELIGKAYEILLAESALGDAASHWVFKERRTGKRASRRKIVWLQTRSGAKRAFELSSAATYNKKVTDPTKTYCGTIVVGWDVTEQLSLFEELQETKKMDALGRLAGGVAHDLNNILFVISNSVDFLREALDSSRPNQDLEQIDRAAERATELTRHLLRFSRKEIVVPNPVHLGQLVNDLRRMLERLLREDIRFELALGEEIGTVLADAQQLEQVLTNLAVNAADAMPDGGVLTIGVSNVTLDREYTEGTPNLAPGRYVMLAVSDTGVGMRPEVQQHMFEPFFTTKDEGRGTGLGLSIVYGIVRQSGGHVSVYSEEDTGTTVKVYLPRVEGEVTAEPRPVEREPVGGSETILLVEDDNAVRRVARRLLEKAGYRVIETASGVQALEAWEVHQPISLLVTDVVMPALGGAPLARRLRDEHPRLPVLYLSGYIGGFRGRHELLSERAAFLAKPFTRRELLDQVRKLIDEQG